LFSFCLVFTDDNSHDKASRKTAHAGKRKAGQRNNNNNNNTVSVTLKKSADCPQRGHYSSYEGKRDETHESNSEVKEKRTDGAQNTRLVLPYPSTMQEIDLYDTRGEMEGRKEDGLRFGKEKKSVVAALC
jgi:hypothetical protein